MIINAAPNVTVVHGTGADSVHSLTASTPFNLTNGSLNLAAASTVAGFTQTGGTLGGTGGLTVNNSFHWSGGTEAGAGTTTVPQGVVLLLDGSTLLDGRRIDAAGTITYIGSLIQTGNGEHQHRKHGTV